jgi:hypothetical protein
MASGAPDDCDGALMSRPSLLHNMSAPPRTVIRQRAVAPSGSTLLFRLPPGFRCAGPGALLARLTGRRRRGAAQAEAELRTLLNEQAARLPLPPAALVAGSSEGAKAVEDLLTVCTVLAKSSDRVYLRDKEPNLGRIALGRSVVIRLPRSQEEKP